MNITLPALTIAAIVLAAYFVFCCAFAWNLRYMPTRWSEIAWKRVDYVWIIVGALALATHAIALNDEAKLLELKIEKRILHMIEQSIDRDTNRLNNTGICLQITSKNLEAHNQLTSELKKACSYLEKSRSANHKNIEPTQKKPAPSKPNKQ